MSEINKENGKRTDDAFRAFVDALTDISNENRFCKQDDPEGGYDEASADWEDVVTSEVTETEHVITIGYSDDDDIVIVTHDTPRDKFALCAPLLNALSLLWPNELEEDGEFKILLHELARNARGEYDVESDNED